MKSITLNRYWQGVGTPNYAPGIYDETQMDSERMVYLVNNGHAEWRPDYEDGDRDTADTPNADDSTPKTPTSLNIAKSKRK